MTPEAETATKLAALVIGAAAAAILAVTAPAAFSGNADSAQISASPVPATAEHAPAKRPPAVLITWGKGLPKF